jgi:lysophospholipase L1-like esterase
VPGEEKCKLGVLAFGDSITNAGGELQWGVALQSWAQWVARALGLAITNHAVDGASAQDVVGSQIPAFERLNAHPGARYELGCLYVGANDVRALDFSADAFERDFRTALRFLSERCDRVLAVTIPLDLGRPRAGTKIVIANEAIDRVAAALGALVVDLREFHARNFVMADRVHPTAFGQIAIADRALAVLERNGLPARVRPRSLILFETTWFRRLQGDVTYVYRSAKVRIDAAFKRLRGWRRV